MKRVWLPAVTAGLLLAGPGPADVKSGIEPGQAVKAFNPQNVTGPDAGKSSCLVCKNGSSPVVAIFARTLDDPLSALIRRVDEATGKHRKEDLGSFVIFLDRGMATEKKAQAFAEAANLKHTVLALDDPGGPKGYNIAPAADVTILLYVDRKVKANFAFEKGKLTPADVEKVMKALPGILAQ